MTVSPGSILNISHAYKAILFLTVFSKAFPKTTKETYSGIGFVFVSVILPEKESNKQTKQADPLAGGKHALSHPIA